MAYMNQAKKVVLAENLKKAMAPFKKKYGLKYSLAVRHHSTIVMTITEGTLDFFKYLTGHDKERQHLQVNLYILRREELRGDYPREFEVEARHLLLAAEVALNTGNHDNSDSQTDYFDVGWYVEIQVGRWDKPYKLTASYSAEGDRP